MGTRDVDDWIVRLRTVGKATPAMMRGVAATVRAEVDQLPSKQADLAGRPWKPGVKGKPVLQHVDKAVTVSVKGTRVVLTLTGYHVFQHFGTSQLPSRPVWPQGKFEGISLGNAIRIGLVSATQQWLARGTAHNGGFAGAGLGTST